MTLHLLEEGRATYDAVQELLAANEAFEVGLDASDGRAHLNPTSALLQRCPISTPKPTADDFFPSTCVLKREFQDGVSPTALTGQPASVEVPTSADRTAASMWAQSVLGAGDHQANVGTSFAQHLTTRYKMNGRYVRAFWINPAYEWAPSGVGSGVKLVLSQRVVVVAMLGYRDESGRRTGGKI
eukprot:3375248-Rhodomonas_salina.1